MDNYYNDDTIQELHDEMHAKAEDEVKKGVFEKLDTRTKLIAGVMIALLAWFWFNGQISSGSALFGIVLVIGIIFFVGDSGDEPKELSWIQCLLALHSKLRFLQLHPIGGHRVIPKGEINVSAIGRKQWYEGRSWKRSCRVDLFEKKSHVFKCYFAEIDLFTGDVITFKYAPQGVFGDETKDIEYIADPNMMAEKRKNKFIGKGGSK